jgi:phenylpyruvate tautomerase PptA (4-oxalocrotonate tautomerase family)
MPMLDIFIPENALTPSAETTLLQRLTDLLLVHEGADPKNPVARALAWVFLHRPAAVFVAGSMVAEPHYRVVASVPQGQFDDERRAAVVKAVTDAILDAEEGSRQHNPARVWVFANEVPDGTWGAVGHMHRLADIAGKVLGDIEKGRSYAQRRLARPGQAA